MLIPQDLFFEKDRCTKKRISVGVVHEIHGPEISDLQTENFPKTAYFFRLFGSGSAQNGQNLIQSIMTRWKFVRCLLNLYPETGGR